MDKKSVADATRAAFQGSGRAPEIIDVEIGDKRTRSEIQDALGGVAWNEIPVGALCRHHDAPFFLSPEGLRYLLPAFIIASLDSPSSPLVDSLVSALTQPTDVEERAHFLAAMEPLSREQSCAVQMFLTFLQGEEEKDWPDRAPTEALSRYWGATGEE